MAVEQFRGYVAAIVAAACVIGGALGAAWAWHESSVAGMTSDLALILSVFTGLIAAGSTFLFVAEGASRASYAAERSYTAGAIAGATIPEAVAAATALSPLTSSTEPAPARTGAAEGSAPAPGPDERADAVSPSPQDAL